MWRNLLKSGMAYWNVTQLTEVRVNGCHSSRETLGQCRKTYCPGWAQKPFLFICSSKTRDGWLTTWATQNACKSLSSDMVSCISFFFLDVPRSKWWEGGRRRNMWGGRNEGQKQKSLIHWESSVVHMTQTSTICSFLAPITKGIIHRLFTGLYHCHG